MARRHRDAGARAQRSAIRLQRVPGLLTTRAVARMLGYGSSAAVRMLVHRGSLRPFGRRGRTTVFRVEEVERYLRDNLRCGKVGGALRDGGASSSTKDGGRA